MPVAVQAGLWGLLAGSALVLDAAVAYFASIPQRLIAFIMSFGSGVLISALAFDLMDEAYRRDGRGIPPRRLRLHLAWVSRRGGGLHRRQRLSLAPRRQAPQAI